MRRRNWDRQPRGTEFDCYIQYDQTLSLLVCYNQCTEHPHSYRSFRPAYNCLSAGMLSFLIEKNLQRIPDYWISNIKVLPLQVFIEVGQAFFVITDSKLIVRAVDFYKGNYAGIFLKIWHINNSIMLSLPWNSWQSAEQPSPPAADSNPSPIWPAGHWHKYPLLLVLCKQVACSTHPCVPSWHSVDKLALNLLVRPA